MPQRVLHALRIGKAVHSRSLILGIDSNGRLGNAIVDLYAKCAQVTYAEKVFDSLEKDVMAWNSLLSMYSTIEPLGKVLRSFVSLFENMIFPNKFTFSIVLSACAKETNIEFGRQVHCKAIKEGLSSNIYVGSSLVSMYAKCEKMEEAAKVFEALEEINDVVWNAMIRGYAQNGDAQKVRELFMDMRSSGHNIDDFTFTSLLSTCAASHDLETGSQFHSIIIKKKLNKNLFVGNALVDMYAKCGAPEDARKIFEHMCDRDNISWNTIIGRHSQNGLYEEALKLYKEMRYDGALPDQATFVTVFRVCSVLSSLREGRVIHSLAFHLAYDLDELTSNTLIDMYAKCGDMKSSSQVFDEIKRKSTVVSWNSMINGYAKNGFAEDALKTFDSMRQTHIMPDEITFLGVLTACSHAGKVSDGRMIFELMISQYRIEARVDHVACMVDLLGRCGYLQEADDFIEAQNLKPDARLWSSLLGACRIHGDDIRGEIAAEKLIELEPQNSSAYILLSNIYASQGRWEKANGLRKAMRDKGVKKTLQQPQLHQNTAESESDAPPKQVAQAMERLNQAGRVIADIRLGADRILEAMFVASHPRQTDMPLQLFLKEDASMRQHLQDLRLIGKKLEESGVLTESLRSRSNSWGLHMPLVCPDGAVVAYAWKRQLAGQAGASAVDRTRLALKAFTDQKRRFFPHIDDGLKMEPRSKKHRASSRSLLEHGREEPVDYKTLPDIQSGLEKLVPNVKVSTYGRLNWLKRANSLPGSGSDDPTEASKPIFQSSSKLRSGHQTEIVDKVAVIELSFPSVFRAVISLNPAGSIDPDAVAFFSPDEGGSYLHARGISVHNVFKHITEHAVTALQYFLGIDTRTALYSLLLWICSFETLFNKPCSKCGRLLAMEKKSALILPPLYRTYQELPLAVKTGEVNLDVCEAYHIGCSSDESL
ncbi:unnamed protein product [Cochlearia groenlandica]